jgi:microcystin-dependent protein
MGLATANITNGVNGTVMSFGTLKDIDTRGSTASAIAVGDETWAAGDILFAHPTVDGKLTKVRPQHDLVVAFITVRHASAGQLAVRITSGNHLEWLHDVSITGTLADNEVLAYDTTSSLWINQTATEAGLVAEGDARLTPAGVISQYAGSTAPTGYLLCEGQSISTTTYSSLFDVIGYAYGGTGSSFNLPNLQNRIPVGKGPDAEFDTLGETGGSKTNTILAANLPPHNHTGTTDAETQDHSHSGTTSGINANHTHTFVATRGRNNIQRATGTASFLRADEPSTGTTSPVSGDHGHTFTTSGRSATHNHTFTTGNGPGTSTAVNNLQPYIVVNYIIKT